MRHNTTSTPVHTDAQSQASPFDNPRSRSWICRQASLLPTQTVHEALEALIAPRVRYEQNPSGGADAGIDTLKFRGAEVVFDDYAPSGTMYMLNSAHIMLFVHGKANFAMSDEGFQKPIDQDALVANILFQGNLAVNNRRKLGVLSGIS